MEGVGILIVDARIYKQTKGIWLHILQLIIKSPETLYLGALSANILFTAKPPDNVSLVFIMCPVSMLRRGWQGHWPYQPLLNIDH